MVRINPINSVNNYTVQNKPSFKADNATNPQIEQLENVSPDFAVKTPMNYTKTGEINLPYDIKAHCYKLSNGQRVIIVPQEGETVLRTYVNTGSMNEPDNLRGISHYIEHNLFNGSKDLQEGDFFKQVDKMGASANASTGFAETNYFISSNLLNEGDLENKIKLHASMLETPLFAVDKLEKEKGIVNSEINMITSNPENIAVNRMLKNLYGIKSSSEDMIGGTTDNISNLTRENVVNYYNNNYYPANMVTVITGDVKPEETMRLMSKYFTSKKTPVKQRRFEPLIPTNKTIREDIISDKANAALAIVGFNSPASDNTKDRIYTEALGCLLANMPGARINTKIKPFNTSSSVQQEKISSNPHDGRALIFTSESTEENCEKVLKAVFNEIGNIANNPPSDKEMQIIKKLMLKSFAYTLDNSFASNDIIGTSILENNNAYLTDFEQIVNSMTPTDLVNTAKKYLDVNKASVCVVHPTGATEATIKQNYKTVSFTGAPKDAINPIAVKEYNTANNYRVVMLNTKTDNVEMLYKIGTDSDFKIKPSTALVLGKLLNEGTFEKTQEEFDADLAQNGIVKGFSASERSIVCSLGCDVNTISKGFQCISDVINNPRFTQEEFERVKNKIRDDILTSQKSAYDKLYSELYKGLPKGYSKEEILKDLDTLTLEDVKALHKRFFENGKGIITIAAPFDRKSELKNEVFNNIVAFKPVKEFNPRVTEESFKPVEQTKVLTDTDFKNQADIIQSYKFKIGHNLKDTAAIRLLNTILGGNSSSRLFTDLREKEKLAYLVKSGYNSHDDIGVINLRIKTTTDNKETGEQSFDNVRKSIEGFKRNIERIKTEKVTEEELENAKLHCKNTILNKNHSASDKIESLMHDVNSLYGIYRENMLLKEIDNITVDDIYNAANYIFSTKPTYSITATHDTLKANEEYLNKLV